MSDPFHTLTNERPASHSRLSAENAGHLAAMEAASARMRSRLNPDPYFQTILQDAPARYHHQSRFHATQWRNNLPFGRDEQEPVQYSTFVLRDPSQSMIQQHPMSALEKPQKKAGEATAANTPTQGPKKIISFNQYKKKAAGEPVGGADVVKQAPRPAAIKAPAEKAREESKEMLQAAEQIEKQSAESLKAKEQAEKIEQRQLAAERKGRRVEMEAAVKQTPAITSRAEEPPSKKRRLTPPPAPSKSATAPVKQQPQPRSPPPSPLVVEPSQKLPAKANAPDKLAKSKEVALPPMLSPLRDEQRVLPSHVEQQRHRKLSPLRKEHQRIPKSSSLRDEPQLPQKLSPLRDEQVPSTLPERITAGLPSNILAALKTKEKACDFAGDKDDSTPKSTSKNDSMLTTNAAVNSASKRRSPAPKNGFRANSHSPAPASRAMQPSDKHLAPSLEKVAIINDANDGEHALVVKLKFKKARRADLQRLLAFLPAPAKSSTSDAPAKPPESRQGDINEPHGRDNREAERRSGKNVATKIAPVGKRMTPAGKRSREDPDAATADVSVPPAKKHKADAQSRPARDAATHASSEKRVRELDTATAEPPMKSHRVDEAKRSTHSTSVKIKATSSPEKWKKVPDALEFRALGTPALEDQRTPDISGVSKSQLTTPAPQNNRLAAVGMSRELSRESNSGTTMAGGPRTPSVSGNSSGSQMNDAARPSPTSAPASKTPAQRAWDAKQKQFSDLGVQLKRAATASSQEQPAQAAVQALESLLAWILAMHCADRAAMSADPPTPPLMQPWRTLPRYWPFVQAICKPYPLLSGLAAHLTIVTTSRIMALAIETPHLAPSQQSLLDIQKIHLRAATEAGQHLHVRTLMAAFPESWTACSTLPPGAIESTSPCNLLTGPFELPIGVHTSPLQGARAASSLLQEWVKQENMQYESRIRAT